MILLEMKRESAQPVMKVRKKMWLVMSEVVVIRDRRWGELIFRRRGGFIYAFGSG